MRPCFECGRPAEHDHHVVPRVYGGTRTVPLCEPHHAIVHERHSLGSSSLIRAGIERARARGVRLGRPHKLTVEVGAAIIRLHAAGMTTTAIAREVGLSQTSVYAFCKANGLGFKLGRPRKEAP